MFIDQKEYQRILEIMPVVCIDFFIVYNNRVFLGKRTNQPCKWEWFVPGWRIQKWETQEEVFERKLFEETGIRPEDISKKFLLGVYDTQFMGNAFDPDMPTHTINVTYVVELKNELSIQVDSQHDKFESFPIWWENQLLPYIQNLMREYISHT